MIKRWISFGGPQIGARFNWLSSAGAIAITFGFAFYCLDEPTQAKSDWAEGKQWVSQNFTWLYILTQDVWCFFLLYIMASKYGKIKLGKDDEKPRYNDFTWFCMLFTCGVAVGLYVYRNPTSQHAGGWDYAHTKSSTETDAQRAQQA